jgi:hypothetical protein
MIKITVEHLDGEGRIEKMVIELPSTGNLIYEWIDWFKSILKFLGYGDGFMNDIFNKVEK